MSMRTVLEQGDSGSKGRARWEPALRFVDLTVEVSDLCAFIPFWLVREAREYTKRGESTRKALSPAD